MGVTDKVKKLRAAAKSPVVLGQWHEAFSTVKKYADANNVPLLAVWSSGDSCGHCIAFEQCLLDSKFKTWAKTSGVAMWIGFNGDKTKDDKFEGTGFTFARNGKLRMYPFVRLYWKKGKVDICKSGDDWTGGTSKGAAKLVSALKTALKAYKPSEPEKPAEPSEPETPQNPVDEGCNGGSCTVPPILGYESDGNGKFKLTVDRGDATGLSEEDAKFIVQAYDKGKA